MFHVKHFLNTMIVRAPPAYGSRKDLVLAISRPQCAISASAARSSFAVFPPFIATTRPCFLIRGAATGKNFFVTIDDQRTSRMTL